MTPRPVPGIHPSEGRVLQRDIHEAPIWIGGCGLYGFRTWLRMEAYEFAFMARVVLVHSLIIARI